MRSYKKNSISFLDDDYQIQISLIARDSKSTSFVIVLQAKKEKKICYVSIGKDSLYIEQHYFQTCLGGCHGLN